MKTGKVAALLDLDPGTIKNWIDRLPEFFTPGAQDGVKLQREIDHSDLLALNTIRILRSEGETNWETIRDHLASGHRDDGLPITGMTVDVGETALSQVEKVLTTTARLESALTRVDDLEGEIAQLKGTIENQRGNIHDLERKLAELEKAKAVADALAAQELEFWRTGRLRYEPPKAE